MLWLVVVWRHISRSRFHGDLIQVDAGFGDVALGVEEEETTSNASCIRFMSFKMSSLAIPERTTRTVIS